MKKPVYTEKISAAFHADQVSKSLTSSYWVESIEKGAGDYHDREAADHMQKLAELLGCKLVPIDTPEVVEVEQRGEIA